MCISYLRFVFAKEKEQTFPDISLVIPTLPIVDLKWFPCDWTSVAALPHPVSDCIRGGQLSRGNDVDILDTVLDAGDDVAQVHP